MMFVTDKHILLEMNKCGSTYAGHLLEDTCGGRYVTKTRHAPVRAIPPGLRKGRRTIGLLRNPFAWYPCCWNSRCKNQPMNPISFEEWFSDYNKIPWRYLAAEFRPPPAKFLRCGAHTFFHLNFYMPRALDVFATYRDMDQVAKDYDSLIDVDDWVWAHRFWETMEEAIGRPLVLKPGRNRNAHPHKPFREYYTPEQRRYVQEHDAFILDRYGYSWDGPEYRCQTHRPPGWDK